MAQSLPYLLGLWSFLGQGLWVCLALKSPEGYSEHLDVGTWAEDSLLLEHFHPRLGALCFLGNFNHQVGLRNNG